MTKQEDDKELMDQVRGVAASLAHQSRNYPPPPAHPVSPPLNIGTPDPKLKHINEK